jgi:uncharacterized protein (DUF1778 family)
MRMSSADKKLVAEAARLRGMTPTEFALKAILRASRKTVERVKVLRFSKRDQEKMLDALMNPGRPNEKLVRAFKTHRKLVKQA